MRIRDIYSHEYDYIEARIFFQHMERAKINVSRLHQPQAMNNWTRAGTSKYLTCD
jgi:hypothetical protein